MSRLRLAVGSFLAAVLLFSAQVHAAGAPDTLGYQGRLTQNGVAVNGSVSVVFSLYAASSGGAVLWTETQSVTVANGLYSAILGQITPLPSIFTQRLWIGVKVGSDAEMAPRQELTSTPFSQHAKNADSAAFADSATTAVTASTATTANSLSDTALTQYGLGGTMPARTNKISTLDTNVNVGEYTSIAIGADGLPVISYHDVSAGRLKVAKCIDLACTGSPTITILDANTNGGDYTSITLGTDGLPVISYHDVGNGHLKVAKCVKADCTGATIITTVDPATNVGDYTSITLAADGKPVISYHDGGNGSNGHLKVAKCVNADCTGATIITTVDPSVNVGLHTSIALAVDGMPIIAYYDATNNKLKVAKCVNADCSGSAAITTQTTGSTSSGLYNSITVGVDGRPMISYFVPGLPYNTLMLARCGNTDCSGGTSLITLAPGMGAYGTTSITLGADGLPIISSYSYVLLFIKCGNVDCSAGTTMNFSLDPSTGSFGQYSSIAIGADGLPVISYYDYSNQHLKVVKCANAWCANYAGRR